MTVNEIPNITTGPLPGIEQYAVDQDAERERLKAELAADAEEWAKFIPNPSQ